MKAAIDRVVRSKLTLAIAVGLIALVGLALLPTYLFDTVM